MARASSGRRARGFTLVELLVVMAVMSVVTTMLVMIFVDMERASAYVVNSDQAREDAREAMTRMVTEIRDAQIPTAGPYAGRAPIISASSNGILFYTSYGTVGGAGTPVLTRFRYRLNSATGLWTLYYQRDTNGNNLIDSGDLSQVIASDVVNHDPDGNGSQSDRADSFTYAYYDASGNLATTGATYTASGTVASGTTSVPSVGLAAITSVNIRLIADLNPKRAPLYLDLRSTVQPRNLRQQ
jgi:prepilin-type N-terminal cleavage/methylation domain-containing protein